MRILLAPAGTRGDFRVLLAFAVALHRRGHETLLASSPGFSEEAAAFGIDFRPVGRDPQVLEEEKVKLGGMRPRVIKQILMEELRLQFEGLRSLCSGFDWVIGAGGQMAGRSVAQSAGIPYRFVAYAPDIFPSRFQSPIPVQLPRLLNALSWSLASRFCDSLLREESIRMRQALGLPPIDAHLAHFFAPELSIIAVDPELGPMPPDVNAPPPVGSFHLPDHSELPTEVLGFLEAGEPPVYIGFGSMPGPDDPATATETILEAMRLVGCRFLLFSGAAGLGGVDLGSRGLLIGSVNFSRLFPRLAAVVHHGGAGTTSAVARAGIPQVIVPHGFEQYGWARRAHQRGLCPRPFNRPRLTVMRLAASVREVLANQQMRARAQELAGILTSRNGVDAAARQIGA